MRLPPLILLAALAALLGCGPEAVAQRQKIDKINKSEKTKAKVVEETNETEESEEVAAPAQPTVVLELCTESGNVTVRGTERHEVRAHFSKELKVALHRGAGTNQAGEAARLVLEVRDNDDEDENKPHFGRCLSSGDIELDVPRNATLFFKSESGDFDVESVAEVHLTTNNGRIAIRHATRAIEAKSIDGDVSVEDSSGRVELESFGGSIEAINICKVAEQDFFKAKNVGSDVLLENVNHSRVEVSTISGEISIKGPLARGGLYDLRTTTGDITLMIPPDSSFKLTAKVSEGGEIVTDFPLKYAGAASPNSILTGGRMVGTYGKGDATLTLVSFNGTLRLRRQ